jgi:hypothetical protein
MTASRYIGGEFCFRDNEPFAAGPGDADRFFPERLGPSLRVCYETGSDALAAILAAEARVASVLWVPANFCMESLERAARKLTDAPSIRVYESAAGLAAGLDPRAAVLWLHFNAWDPACAEARRAAESAGALFIEDFTHAPLDMAAHPAAHAFASLRKFAALEVAVAYSPAALPPGDIALSRYKALKTRASTLKSGYQGDPDPAREDAYLDLYRKAEATLAEDPNIVRAQASEKGLLARLDFAAMRGIRMENHARLSAALGEAGFAVLPGSYMYAMARLPQRDALRRHCFAHGIFPAIHWADSGSRDSSGLISFHIDQRYRAADMDRAAEAVRGFHAPAGNPAA